MAPYRPTTHVVSSPIQREALASPLRLEIVSFFEHGRELSVRDVAARLDRPIASLYFHVHKLVRSGLLVESSSRGRGPAQEMLYRAVADRIALPVDPRSTDAFNAAVKSVRALLRLVGREFESACRTPGVLSGQDGLQASGRRQRAWLNDKDADEVRKRLDALERFIIRRSRKSGGAEYTWTSMFLPAVRPRRSRGHSMQKGKK